MERFSNNLNEASDNSIGYKLFAFGGTRSFYPKNSLRSCTTNKREIFSDVFIFERSERSEYYTLVVLKNQSSSTNWDMLPKEVYFTIGVAYFNEDHEFLQD